MDKRLAREAAARRQKEKADQAAQAAAQRKLEREKAAVANGAPTPTTPLGASSASAVSTTLVSSPPAASPSHEVAGTPIPTASPANTAAASAVLASAQPWSFVSSRRRPKHTGSSDHDQRRTRFSPTCNLTGSGSRRGNSPFTRPNTGHSGRNASPEPVRGSSSRRDRFSSTDPHRSRPSPLPPKPLLRTSSRLRHRAMPLQLPVAPPPRVLITVDKAAQRMRVTVDGKLRHSWAVSTGRAQHETPTGTFRPLHLARVHYSREWDDAPMPHSIFFTDRGHAIHGSNATRSLGRRASHGCVRLAPSKAAALFALVQAEGQGMTKLIITPRRSGSQSDEKLLAVADSWTARPRNRTGPMSVLSLRANRA